MTLATDRNYITADTVTRSNAIIEENNNWINSHRQTIEEWIENYNVPDSANNIILSSFMLILLLSVSLISIRF